MRIVVTPGGTGHAAIQEYQRAWTSQAVFYEEHNYALHLRWSLILQHIPDMKTRYLYEDLSDVYQRAIDGPPGVPLLCAYDLAVIQQRFWHLMWENKWTLPSAYGYHVNATSVWQRHLFRRLEQQRIWRRNASGKLKRPIAKPVDTKPAQWLH